MRTRAILGLSLLIAAGTGCAWSQTGSPGQQDTLQWLQRVGAAAEKLSYSGTFVYRSGGLSETSRIAHVVANGQRMEKLEVLDGSPREVIRHNDEVKCYLPDSRQIIVEQRSARRTFPALLPASLSGLGEHYLIRKGARARVAGFDSQIVRLEPRDAWRYGRQFWVEPETGLLLKADLFDERGESLETLAFTELRMGEPANPDVFKPSVAQRQNWQVKQTRSREARGEEARWSFRAELPGFRRQAVMRRDIAQDGVQEAREVLHWVYSDGLAAISVFIDPLPPGAPPPEVGAQAMGAISVMRRVVDGHLVVVMGDAPSAAVRRFADGIEMRAK